jgi:hypothetical protein
LVYNGCMKRKEMMMISSQRILVLVKEDRQKESQFNPTTHKTLSLVKVSGKPNFEKINFVIFTTLTTQNLCSVSIVKRGQLL